MHTRLTHVRANVRDLQKALDWYCSVLQFEVEGLWPTESPVYAAFISQEGATYAIGVADPVPTGARFNFSVEDVDALWEYLEDKVEIVEALYDTPNGTRKFTILDLDGNELGFTKG